VPNWCFEESPGTGAIHEITTIGLGLAKHVFQVHGIDAQGTTVLRKRLRRGQVLAFFSRIPSCSIFSHWLIVI
jgi:transposase